MGELGRAPWLQHDEPARRRSLPVTCVDRDDVPDSCKTRRSVDVVSVVGRGVPDVVRTSRYDKDSRKRAREDHLSVPSMPAKRAPRTCNQPFRIINVYILNKKAVL